MQPAEQCGCVDEHRKKMGETTLANNAEGLGFRV